MIFLNEPTAGLDVESRQHLWVQVREFARADKTILLTTHHLEEAHALADRIVLIDRGHVIANETPTVLKSRVAAKRVEFDVRSPVHQADFAALPVQTLDFSGQRICFLWAEPEGMLRAIFSQGVEIRNLDLASAGIEEAFLSPTHREGADRGTA